MEAINTAQVLIPRTDEAELQQLHNLGTTQGLGEPLYDNDEFRDTLGELGIGIPDFDAYSEGR